MSRFIKLKYFPPNFITYTECKRCAGHSKWANIKRTKMATDQKKSTLTQSIIKKMKLAVDTTKNTDPDTNIMLARVIVEAKKNSIPAATITAALENLKNLLNHNPAVYISKGPYKILIIIQLISDNPNHRLKINGQLKKLGFSPCEVPKVGILNEEGLILTEKISDFNENKIIEDAIEVGAENAELIKEINDEFIQFTCLPSDLLKVRNKLERRNYKILESEIQYTPQNFITLTDVEMEFFEKFCNKIKSYEEVLKLDSNIL